MRIGLLISEFHDKAECDLCIGADCAAKDLGAELIVFPGRHIITDKTVDKYEPYAFQHQAVYDYCIETGFDGLIVDIDRIGDNAPILKKEAFLKQFGKKTILTISKMEGFDCVEAPSFASDTEIGYLSVEQMISKITGNKVTANRQKEKEFTLDDYRKSIDKISAVTDLIINNNYNIGDELCYEYLIKKGVDNFEVYLLEEPLECSLKKGWKMPKHCVRTASIHDGKNDIDACNEDIIITSVFSQTKIKSTKVIRNFFFGFEQLGFIITEFGDDFRTGNYDDILTNFVVALNRLTYFKRRLKDSEEELAQCQEELARDGSVLDHIGDQDYLTELPNRRGFFAKAYDLLKSEFKENTYAVVAYIDMDSLKNINAIHGHDEGDKAVCRVADILTEVFGEKSVCGRIRGDEFAVIQVTDEEDKAEALRIEMARQNNRLLMDNTKYINHLIYSICEFDYADSLSLREMLKETDDNLKNMRRMELI